MKSNRNYTVYFEIYGRKMKTTVLAENEQKAREEVQSKLNIQKIVADDKNYYNQAMDIIDGIIDLLK